jgi:ABC-2 type transport system ATP-binding protein
MDTIESRYHEVLVHPDRLGAARALNPIAERQSVGHTVLIFEGPDRGRFAEFGDVHTPSVADLFIAIISSRAGEAQEVKG